MSLSARASRRVVKLSGDEAAHARTFQRSTAVARNVHVAGRPQGLVVRGQEEEGRRSEEDRQLGSGAATPSSFWRGTPSLGPLDGPSPSNSCGDFEGCYCREPTPRAASNRLTLGAVGSDHHREKGSEEDADEGEEEEEEEDSSIDSHLMFDLEP